MISRVVGIHILILYNFQVTDDKNVRWQIVQTTFRKDTKAMTHVACVPLRLSTSWERISINLAKVTHALFGTKYTETSKIKVSVLWVAALLREFASLFCPFSFRFTPTAAYGGCFSPTDCTPTKSCQVTFKSP